MLASTLTPDEQSIYYKIYGYNQDSWGGDDLERYLCEVRKHLRSSKPLQILCPDFSN